jgi:hypothetical protein
MVRNEPVDTRRGGGGCALLARSRSSAHARRGSAPASRSVRRGHSRRAPPASSKVGAQTGAQTIAVQGRLGSARSPHACGSILVGQPT